MSDGDPLAVNDDVFIPRSELTFRATRSGGPGGQHVNTSSTRIELLWNARHSRAVRGDARRRLLEKLGTRMDASGVVRVVASAYRSQARNREDAAERLAALVRRALVVPKPRKKTRPSRSAVESRLREKQQRSDRKRERQRRDFD